MRRFAGFYAATYPFIVGVVILGFHFAHDLGAPLVPIEVALASPRLVPWLVVAGAVNLMLAGGLMFLTEREKPR